MLDFHRHLIQKNATLKEALQKLNELAADAILFVVDENDILVGSLTDGDVRRGFLRGLTFDNIITDFVQSNPHYLKKDNYSINKVVEYRNQNYKVIPIVDDNFRIINIVNFRITRSYLPIDAVVMAGGRGERLRPMTDVVPKPLLKVGDKPIIMHSLERLSRFGIDNIWITVRYLGEKIIEEVGDGNDFGAKVSYCREQEPLGTIGALKSIKDLKHDYVLVSNSDILTNIDYEDFFLDFLRQGAELAVVSIPYTVNIPYAVLETEQTSIISFKEKPSYTYYSNGGIYLMKREAIDLIPEEKFFNATDLMEKLIVLGRKVISYPLHSYWLDIGKPEDFIKAQADIKHISM